MRKTIIVPGLLVLAFAACRPPAANVRRVPVGSSACREIRLIEKAGAMAADAIAVVAADGKLVVPPLHRELAAIQDVLVSPEKGFALVVSVGEGHPWISVYKIADWLAPLPGGADGVAPFRTMDPYPFDWSEIRWLAEDEIRFKSAGDYARFDAATRRPGGSLDAPTPPPARGWAWILAEDKVLAADDLR